PNRRPRHMVIPPAHHLEPPPTRHPRPGVPGAAQLILRSMPEAGPVTLTFSAPGLNTQKVMLKTE
ncbi:MAG: hypothetical protein K2L26_09035, partial [Duncaniella sp.]|nr:hypothetical protein [Duncaniella sp.]